VPLPAWFWDEDPVVHVYVKPQPPPEPVEDPRQALANLLNSAGGRQKLAASMAAPLRARLDYAAVGRKTFLVQQIPDGALPIYDKDPEPLVVAPGSRCHPSG